MLSCVFFFFKQKTAYEMRISDWSSDVCSSDLMGTQSPAPASSKGISVRNRPPTMLPTSDSEYRLTTEPTSRKIEVHKVKLLGETVDELNARARKSVV